MIKYILTKRGKRSWCTETQRNKGRKTEVVNLPKGKVFRLSNGESKSIFHSFVL